jgi:REP element-mobilizing transposase RayT
MSRDPHKGHAALRRGRVSIPGAEYFLTVCTDARCVGLTASAIAESILAEAGAMAADTTWTLRCAVVMPDHVHLLVVLGSRLALGKVVARLKSKTAKALGAVDLKWEREFYDHHIRPNEERLALFLYVYLNPYRAKLCKRSEAWRWYYCGPEDWRWFKDCLLEERPAPEWLKD